MKKYTFFTDPGHGWLAVTIKELFDLNLIGKISNYSYFKGEIAYLEEDCDAGKFINAKEAMGYSFKEVGFNEVHNEVTPIRNYSSFSQFNIATESVRMANNEAV